MRRLSILACVAAAAAVAVIPAGASAELACNGAVTAIGDFGYIDDRDFVDGEGIWLYAESNGEAGLQSGGTSLIGEADDCSVAPATPDTLIF